MHRMQPVQSAAMSGPTPDEAVAEIAATPRGSVFAYVGEALAVFAIGGSLKALGAGMDPLTAVFVGGITAIGGGMIRDVLAGQVPEVLRREMYALPAIFGSALIVTAHHFDLISPAVIWGCVALAGCDYERALGHFEQAATIDAQRPGLLLQIGEAYLRRVSTVKVPCAWSERRPAQWFAELTIVGYGSRE